MFVGAFALIAMLAVGLYLSLNNKKSYMLMGAFCSSMVFIFVVIVGLTAIVRVGSKLKQRLSCTQNEKLIERFNVVYNRLQLVLQEGSQFLYKIEEGDAEEEKIAHSLAAHVYIANEKRALVSASNETTFDITDT